MAQPMQPYDPKSYTIFICTAGASENGLADARLNTHLRLDPELRFQPFLGLPRLRPAKAQRLSD